MGPPGKPVDVSKLDPAFVAESNAAMILAITGVFHFLALIVVALRLYTRSCMIRAIGKDDWVMLLAVVRFHLLHPAVVLAYLHMSLGNRCWPVCYMDYRGGPRPRKTPDRDPQG